MNKFLKLTSSLMTATLLTANTTAAPSIALPESIPVIVATESIGALPEPAPEPVPELSKGRYNITPLERDLIERIVMAEAGGETYIGQVAVAQCILNACELDDIRPVEAVRKYKYARPKPVATESVKSAVSAVFDSGETVIDEKIMYFYAPALVMSKWHETQVFVTEIGCHRFFERR